jgi:hypothetical protein
MVPLPITSSGVQAQQLKAVARKLLETRRPLAPTDIALIMDAVRAEMSGKTFQLKNLGDRDALRIEVQMRSDGKPRLLTADGFNGVRGISEYSGQAARSCDGVMLAEELVVHYDLNRDGHWQATARLRDRFEMDSDYFSMFARGAALEDQGIVRSSGRILRRFVADWRDRWVVQSSTPLPNFKQFILIDTATLMPIHWEPVRQETTLHEMPSIDGVTFVYDPAIRITPPADVRPPDCVK